MDDIEIIIEIWDRPVIPIVCPCASDETGNSIKSCGLSLACYIIPRYEFLDWRFSVEGLIHSILHLGLRRPGP